MALTTTTKFTAVRTHAGLTLTAMHSRLEFTYQPAAFGLFRDQVAILSSGAGWGGTDAAIIATQSDDYTSVITVQRGDTIAHLTVQATHDGWHFAWDGPSRDTFDLRSGGHWYGQGEMVNQGWPLETISLWEAPLLTWDNGPTGLGDIQTPIWIAASGAAIFVEQTNERLRVGLNAPPADMPVPLWNLSAMQAPAADRPPLAVHGADGLLALATLADPLDYYVLVGANAPDVFRAFVARIGKPDRIPPQGLLQAPIWTTWARYKTQINQETILSFAREIRQYDYPGRTLEIDDKWQVNYGDTWFDVERFPDPAQMIKDLNALGFAATLWITPFLHPTSANTQEAVRLGYVVTTVDGSPYDVPWWQGTAYLLDMSNPDARQWWADKLRQLQDSAGLAGFKFDAGEGNFLPADAVTFAPMPRNEFSTRWVEFAAANFPYAEARCGWYSQRYPILFRHWDKFSTWGLDNGLASVITTALALSMSGYPFLLPDMIGGNAYGGITADKELLIRWTQASAPMLTIQFSIVPWDYDAETIEICRKYARLHVDLAEDRTEAARQAVQTGVPVIRPIFWVSPNDTTAQRINDEYMLGDKYLVAPVIIPGAVERDVYLPAGQWRDYWSGTVYGSGWINAYPAPLDVLPIFVRI